VVSVSGHYPRWIRRNGDTEAVTRNCSSLFASLASTPPSLPMLDTKKDTHADQSERVSVRLGREVAKSS